MSNAYETGEQKVIPSTLVYLFSKDRVLMIHRIKKDKDIHQDKWNGLGGKLEKGESPLQGAQREVFEEAGLQLEAKRLKSLGSILFPNFKAARAEDWWVFFFVGEVPDAQLAQIHAECAEGRLEWVPKDEVMKLNLWEGDRKFLPYVLQQKPFVGCFWYENQQLVRDWLQPL